MKHVISFVLALVMVMLAVTMLSKGVISDGRAVATRVDGTVVIVSKDAPAGRVLRKNDSIAKNDRLEVQGNSRLELRLPGNGFLRLSDNTRLTLRMLQFEERMGTLYLQAFLHNGKLWAKVNKRETPNSRVDVFTDAGLAAGKDSVFGVDTTGDTNAKISVYEGSALVTSAAAEAAPVSVRTLQQVAVSAQGGVAEPEDFDLKVAMTDWIRWNLQRDAREGLVSITVTPASPMITRGTSLQLTAVAHYPDNFEKDVTSYATWSSSDANVAKIDPFGNAAGTEIGESDIAAAIEDTHGSTVLSVSRNLVSLKVTPASQSVANGVVQQFRAIGTFSDKTVKDVTSSAVWKSSNTAVAVVDAAGRAVAGNAAGKAVISASLGTKHGKATLRVRRELVSITIMPESASVLPGNTQRYGAVGSYSDKTTEDLTEKANWESSDIGIAVMDQVQPGRVLGQKAGSATITATYKDISGKGSIEVETITPP